MDQTDPMATEHDGEEVVVIRRSVVLGVIIAISVLLAGILIGRNVWLDHQHQQEIDRFHQHEQCIFSGRTDC